MWVNWATLSASQVYQICKARYVDKSVSKWDGPNIEKNIGSFISDRGYLLNIDFDIFLKIISVEV